MNDKKCDERVFVVFGSKSDERVYAPLCEKLKEIGCDVDFAVISAHRNPKELSQRLSEGGFDVVVAGAGLAAHLPGVVASQVEVPVFGVPVAAHFGGLDSLFSIFQMPFGVPVLGVAPQRPQDNVADFLFGIRKIRRLPAPEEIAVVIKQSSLKYEFVEIELDRSQKYANSRGIKLKIVDKVQSDRLNIALIQEEAEIQNSFSQDTCCINVPLMEKNMLNSPSKALEIFYWISKGGVWVGVNNTRNAICAWSKFWASN